MTISKDILDIILILTPGIISFYIIEALTHHKKIEYQRVILNIMVLNFIIYFLIYLISIGYMRHFFNLESITMLSKETNISIMSLGLFFSILIGFISSLAINKKYIFKIAQYFNTSDLNSNLNVWDDFLSDKRSFDCIIVRDKTNNIMYYAITKRYSEFSLEKRELHLVDVRILNNETAEELYRQEELYLVINDTMTIEIPNIQKEDND